MWRWIHGRKKKLIEAHLVALKRLELAQRQYLYFSTKKASKESKESTWSTKSG
jgi:hypothetical protein